MISRFPTHTCLLKYKLKALYFIHILTKTYMCFEYISYVLCICQHDKYSFPAVAFPLRYCMLRVLHNAIQEFKRASRILNEKNSAFMLQLISIILVLFVVYLRLALHNFININNIVLLYVTFITNTLCKFNSLIQNH